MPEQLLDLDDVDRRCSTYKLRGLEPSPRYDVLICFLWQTYCDSIDHLFDM